MIKIITATCVLLVAQLLGSAQVTRDRRATDSEALPVNGPTARGRVVSTPRSNHVESERASTESESQSAVGSASPGTNHVRARWGNTPVEPKSSAIVRSASAEAPANRQTESDEPVLSGSSQIIPGSATVRQKEIPSRPARATESVLMNANRALPSTTVYRVGVGDVLDVRLSNLPTRESTLFTVLKNGTLEYPLLSSPIPVAGLTTDEISHRLAAEIKVIQNARISVSVRDFASHAVLVTGAVENPGRKILRREAMPLFALVAESLPRPEAKTAVVTRGAREQSISLLNTSEMSMLVLPGDIVRVAAGTETARRYIYVAGDVLSPGEKEFREGMTLTQALISAGGGTHFARLVVRISRRKDNGFLTSTEYEMGSIEAGKSADPLVEAGDRLEVIQRM